MGEGFPSRRKVEACRTTPRTCLLGAMFNVGRVPGERALSLVIIIHTTISGCTCGGISLLAQKGRGNGKLERHLSRQCDYMSQEKYAI